MQYPDEYSHVRRAPLALQVPMSSVFRFPCILAVLPPDTRTNSTGRTGTPGTPIRLGSPVPGEPTRCSRCSRAATTLCLPLQQATRRERARQAVSRSYSRFTSTKHAGSRTPDRRPTWPPHSLPILPSYFPRFAACMCLAKALREERGELIGLFSSRDRVQEEGQE